MSGKTPASEGEGFVPFHEPQDGAVATTNVPLVEGSEREQAVVRGTSASHVVTGGFVAVSGNPENMGKSAPALVYDQEEAEAAMFLLKLQKRNIFIKV